MRLRSTFDAGVRRPSSTLMASTGSDTTALRAASGGAHGSSACAFDHVSPSCSIVRCMPVAIRSTKALVLRARACVPLCCLKHDTEQLHLEPLFIRPCQHCLHPTRCLTYYLIKHVGHLYLNGAERHTPHGSAACLAGGSDDDDEALVDDADAAVCCERPPPRPPRPPLPPRRAPPRPLPRGGGAPTDSLALGWCCCIERGRETREQQRARGGRDGTATAPLTHRHNNRLPHAALGAPLPRLAWLACHRLSF